MAGDQQRSRRSWAPGYRLTRREQDVVHLVLLGADTAAIGVRLFLSPWTVQDHLKQGLCKVDLLRSQRREHTFGLAGACP